MRILLVAAPQGNGIVPVVPLGLLYVANALERAGYEIEILDMAFKQSSFKDLSDRISTLQPDIAAVSMRNIAETAELNNLYDIYRDIVKLLKTRAVVILGGAGFSIFSEELKELTGADYGVAGEGEAGIITLIRNIAEGSLDKANENIIQPLPGTDFAESNIIAVRRKHWNAYGQYYSLVGSPVPVQTSRGCSFNCSYCSYPVIQGHQLRTRSIAAVAEEFVSIGNMTGVREVFFVDSILNADYKHAFNLSEEISRSYAGKRKIPWQCCVNPVGLDKPLLYSFKKSGCVGCDLGIDSFSNQVLHGLRKGFDGITALQAAKALEEIGIPYRLSLVLGAPGETAGTLADTVQKAEMLKPVAVHAFIGVRLYPGTPIVKEFCKPGEKMNTSLLHPGADAFFIAEESKETIKNLLSSPPKNWFFSNKSILKIK